MQPVKATAAVLTGPRQVELREMQVAPPGPGEIRIATLYSGISAGTEMNVYRGVAPQWAMHRDPDTKLFARSSAPDWKYPFVYGYANVGRVVDIGDGVTSPRPGDVVFSYSPHQSVVVAPAESTVKVPEGLDARLAVLNSNVSLSDRRRHDAAVRHRHHREPYRALAQLSPPRPSSDSPD